MFLSGTNIISRFSIEFTTIYRIRRRAAVTISAIGQPAAGTGKRTNFSGEIIDADSAMK